MSDFFVGQRVVYIGSGDNSRPDLKEVGQLKRNNIYTIRWAGTSSFCGGNELEPAIRLAEVVRTFAAAPYYNDWPFGARHFRPLASKAISIFRAIAANPHIKISEDA